MVRALGFSAHCCQQLQTLICCRLKNRSDEGSSGSLWTACSGSYWKRRLSDCQTLDVRKVLHSPLPRIACTCIEKHVALLEQAVYLSRRPYTPLLCN
jgi:hypothetical protein